MTGPSFPWSILITVPRTKALSWSVQVLIHETSHGHSRSALISQKAVLVNPNTTQLGDVPWFVLVTEEANLHFLPGSLLTVRLPPGTAPNSQTSKGPRYWQLPPILSNWTGPLCSSPPRAPTVRLPMIGGKKEVEVLRSGVAGMAG